MDVKLKNDKKKFIFYTNSYGLSFHLDRLLGSGVEMMNFVLKMMNVYIENDEFCITNDEFCVKHYDFGAASGKG